MRRIDAALRVMLALALVLGSSQASRAEMTVAFSNPSAGQDYSIGGNPSYNGTAAWDGTADYPYVDSTPTQFEIDLVFSSLPDLNGAVIVDSENATITSSNDNTGNATWANPSPSSTITMSQYQSFKTGYYLKCVPSADGAYYYYGENIIYGSVALGTIQ